jgi:hypothetical protein
MCCVTADTVQVVARSEAWVCGRSLAGTAGLNPARGMGVVSCECCQEDVSETGWTLVQRSLTQCGVPESDREASIIRPWPPRDRCALIYATENDVDIYNMNPQYTIQNDDNVLNSKFQHKLHFKIRLGLPDSHLDNIYSGGVTVYILPPTGVSTLSLKRPYQGVPHLLTLWRRNFLLNFSTTCI